MVNLPAEFEQFHWMVDMVQNVDLGLIVINRIRSSSLEWLYDSPQWHAWS